MHTKPFPRYFSQIDEAILEQILEIYQLDFDLFNYDSSKYLKMVQARDEKQLDVYNRLDFEDGKEETSKVFS